MDKTLRFILVALSLFCGLATIQATDLNVPQSMVKATVSTKEEARQRMAALVEQFRTDTDAKKLKESETRSHYIDEFWRCLGWDMVNETRAELYQQESIHESRIFVGNRNLYIDYKQVAGDQVFMVEAKRVKVSVDKLEHIFQAKRYCWSSMRAEVAALTNFKSLRVFDARRMPKYDEPKQGEIAAFRLEYTEYLSNFDLLYDTFSREAVSKGSLRKMLDKIDPKKTRVTIDVALIGHMEKLRLSLAQGLIDNNPDISPRDLNAAVHNMLNRILFARIIEDRDIESSGVLRNLILTWRGDKLVTDGKTSREPSQESLHSALVKTFTGRLRERYKGVVFNHHPGDKLKFPDTALLDAIMSLYPQDTENPQGCPYDFAVVPVGVIGKIYESYLGKRIIVQNGKAKLELTPSVRDSGGVFYTPDTVAYYMAQRTLQPLIAEKSPEEIMKLRIVDPALGCGALLIQAQRVIHEEMRNYYARNPEKIGNRDTEFPDAIIREDGSVKLSPILKAKLVGESFYGVDIDAQAVEIASMWLYIGILQDENHALSDRERRWKIPHRANRPSPHFELPDLSRNFVIGNSLVEPDYQGDDREEAKPFDWHDNPTRIMGVMAAGGFDACLANPPYQGYRKMTQYIPEQLKYFRQKYHSLSYQQGDLSFAFVERGIQILKPGGRMGYILTNRFLFNSSGTPLRDMLKEQGIVQEIVNFNLARIFDDASVNTALLFVGKSNHPYFMYANLLDPKAANEMLDALDGREVENGRFFVSKIYYKDLSDKNWNFPPPGAKDDSAVIGTQKAVLGDYADVMTGIETGADRILVVEPISTEGDLMFVKSRKSPDGFSIERAVLKPFVLGRDIQEYTHVQAPRFVIYLYDENNTIIPEDAVREKYPKAYAYLESHKSDLLKRARVTHWYGLNNTRNKTEPKLLMAIGNKTAIDLSGEILFTSGSLIAGVVPKKKEISGWMLLGILNSDYIREYSRSSSSSLGGQNRVLKAPLRRTPIPQYNEQTAPVYQQLEQHVQSLVNQTPLPDTAKPATRRQIEELVRELYRLGAETASKKAALRVVTPHRESCRSLPASAIS